MPSKKSDPVSPHLMVVRGRRVIIDAELARLYGTTTKAFNQAFKRNARRFPADFAFQLSAAEFRSYRQQPEAGAGASAEKRAGNRSQIVTSARGRHRRLDSRPWVFTEHGAVMAANVLRSKRAVEMSVYVVRAFVQQREALMANATILRRIAEIDKTLLEHDSVLRTMWEHLQPLLMPPEEKLGREVGFHTTIAPAPQK